MTPTRKPHTNKILNAPQDWDESQNGPCNGLPVTESEGIFYSYWSPTFRERLNLLFGRTVRLCLVGSAHPPVALDTEPE